MSSSLPVALGRSVRSPSSPPWIGIVPRPEGVAVARAFTRSKLTGYDQDFAYDTGLVVSELVTNAYEAAVRAALPEAPDLAALIRLTVRCSPTWVHLRVADTAVGVPARSDAPVASVHGRGLSIVEELSRMWWVHHRPGGKTVHAVMTIPGVVLTQYDLDRLVTGL